MRIRRQERRGGYTLVETMMVVGIVAVTALAATPSMVKRIPHKRLSQASWQLYTDLHHAKARAVSENTPVTLNVNVWADEYTIWVDSNRNGSQDSGETTTRDFQNIPGANINAYPRAVTFKPTGMMDCTFYYFYLEISVPGAGTRYIYTFPNGHIDAAGIQKG